MFDNSGAGRPQQLPAPLTIDAMADQTSALIDTLGLGRPNVLSWSGGRSRVVTDQGADMPPVGEQMAGGGPALVPGGSGDHDRLDSNVHGGLPSSRFLH
jgi:hypothetical protein